MEHLGLITEEQIVGKINLGLSFFVSHLFLRENLQWVHPWTWAHKPLDTVVPSNETRYLLVPPPRSPDISRSSESFWKYQDSGDTNTERRWRVLYCVLYCIILRIKISLSCINYWIMLWSIMTFLLKLEKTCCELKSFCQIRKE